MTRKRFSEEAALDLLRQIDLDLASGGGFVTLIRRSTCRTGGGRLCRQGDMVPRRNCRDAEQSVGPS